MTHTKTYTWAALCVGLLTFTLSGCAAEDSIGESESTLGRPGIECGYRSGNYRCTVDDDRVLFVANTYSDAALERRLPRAAAAALIAHRDDTGEIIAVDEIANLDAFGAAELSRMRYIAYYASDYGFSTWLARKEAKKYEAEVVAEILRIANQYSQDALDVFLSSRAARKTLSVRALARTT